MEDMIIMQSLDLTIKVVFASRKLTFVKRLIVMNRTTNKYRMADYRYTELSFKITSLISRTCCLGSSGLT